jgi:hypothetical protein
MIKGGLVLLTNGCSFVWGDELEGYDQSPPNHWHHTFTHKLSEKLGIKYVNLATCGACNTKIFRDTVDYLRTTDELPTHIVIIWSAWQREEVAENHPRDYEIQRNIQRFQCMTQISPSRLNNVKTELAAVLDSFYDYYDSTRTGIIRTLNYMTHMQWLCDILGIKIIQGAFHQRMWNNLVEKMHTRYRTTEADWSDWMDYVQESIDSLRDECRVGLGRYTDFYNLAKSQYTIRPYGHPDEDAHTEFSQLLYHIFETRYGDKE